MLSLCLFWFIVFFFKQKTAYELRISDWSSDVCSSDLPGGFGRTGNHRIFRRGASQPEVGEEQGAAITRPCGRHGGRRRERRPRAGCRLSRSIGCASCSKRVCVYVELSVVVVYLKRKSVIKRKQVVYRGHLNIKKKKNNK